jgi:hypothetical protein
MYSLKLLDFSLNLYYFVIWLLSHQENEVSRIKKYFFKIKTDFTSVLIISDVKYADFTSGMKNLPLWNACSNLEKGNFTSVGLQADVDNDLSQRLCTRWEMLRTYNITFSYIGWDPMWKVDFHWCEMSFL